jgi:hypothetical protein
MQFVVEGLLLLSGENGDLFDGRQVRPQVPAGKPVNVIDVPRTDGRRRRRA